MQFGTLEKTAEWVKQYCEENNINPLPTTVFEGFPAFGDGVGVDLTRESSASDIDVKLSKKSAPFTKWFEQSEPGFKKLFATIFAGIEGSAVVRINGIWRKNSAVKKGGNVFVVQYISITSSDKPEVVLARSAMEQILSPFKDKDFKAAYDFSSWAASVDFNDPSTFDAVIESSRKIQEEAGVVTVSWLPAATEGQAVRDVGSLPFQIAVA